MLISQSWEVSPPKNGLGLSRCFFFWIDSTRFSQPSPPFTAETSQASKHVPRRSKGSPFTSTNWCSCWMPNTSWAWRPQCLVRERAGWILNPKVIESDTPKKSSPASESPSCFQFFQTYIYIYVCVLYYIHSDFQASDHILSFRRIGVEQSPQLSKQQAGQHHLPSPQARGEVLSTWLPSPIIHLWDGFLKLGNYPKWMVCRGKSNPDMDDLG